MKKTILTLISLITAVCGILVARHVLMLAPAKCASQETSKTSEAPLLKEWINNSIDEDLPLGYVQRYQWAGDEEREKLKHVWEEAATNLLHGDVGAMKECVATVAERMKSIAPEQFCDIIGPCYSFLKGEFLGGILSRSYAGVDEFNSIVMVDIAGMNILGDVELVSAVIPRQCAYLEADALAMIRNAIKKFTTEERGDFISVARELEEMIINQIESDDGLTRRYMNADLKMQMLLYERGYSTRENVIRGVRTDAWHLENTTGYTPKWLDEFK